MMFSFAAFALVSALAVSAADINVRVGDGGLVFNPTSVTGQVGDTIHFQFISKNHSVTQSTFGTPCVQAPNGIDSGFLAADPASTLAPSWSFTLDATTPLWFFCAQTNPLNHCQSGMVFAVNPTADKTFDAYLANAKNAAAAGGAAGASGVAGASGTGSIIPPPTSLPTSIVVASAGASSSGIASSLSFPTGVASGSGFSTLLGSATSTAGATGGSAAPGTSPSAVTNGAVVVGTKNSAVAVSVVTLFAAVAGFLL